MVYSFFFQFYPIINCHIIVITLKDMSHMVDAVGKFNIGINQFIWGQTLKSMSY